MVRSMIILLLICFSLNSFSQEINLNSYKEIKGKDISSLIQSDRLFLYFWAHWCTECEGKFKTYFPEITKKSSLPILTVNTDSKESKALSFIEKFSVSLPVIMDTQKELRKVVQVSGVPAWALLKKKTNGVYQIVSSKIGFDEAEVNKIFFEKIEKK